MESVNSSIYGNHFLIGWKWNETGTYLSFSILLLITTIIKIIYFKNRKVLNNIPESCALILLGILVGLLIVIMDSKSNNLPEFTPSLFNFILLPPIVLDSSYELYHQSFFGNIGTIIMFAVVGTIMNVILVAYLIYFSQMISLFGKQFIPTVEIFIFSVIVSAVDPVAVLSVFQEVNVNKALYFLVFGESLLNDAVVITLYDNIRSIPTSNYPKSKLIGFIFLSFLVSTFGGICVGIFWGILTCLLTQLTTDRKLKAVEPLIVIVLAYLAYLTGYLLNFSAIISLMTCGLFQAEYANHNISRKSKTTVKYLTKLSSSVTETIIFLFLGLVLVNTKYVWNTSFVIFSTFYCIIARFVTIFALTYFVNVYFQRIRIVNLEEQVLMAYGGLRGAITFSLSDALLHQTADTESIKLTRRLITTTNLFIILFTIFVLGSTTKPLVKMLRVQLQTKGESEYLYEVNNRVTRLLMQGIEIIAAQQSPLHWLKKIASIMNEKFLKKFLLRKFNQENKILSKQDSSSVSSAQRSYRYDVQNLETPEKDVYPDLNKPIRQFEAFDDKGTLLFPKLDQNPVSIAPTEVFLEVCDISRVFTIPKEACSLINSWISLPNNQQTKLTPQKTIKPTKSENNQTKLNKSKATIKLSTPKFSGKHQ